MKSVYSAVRTGSLNKAVCSSSVKGSGVWKSSNLQGLASLLLRFPFLWDVIPGHWGIRIRNFGAPSRFEMSNVCNAFSIRWACCYVGCAARVVSQGLASVVSFSMTATNHVYHVR